MEFDDKYNIWFEKNNDELLLTLNDIIYNNVLEFAKEIENIIKSGENVIPKINSLIDTIYAIKAVKIGSLEEKEDEKVN